ncbi:hypothetical protein QYM36_001187 [Artemia franciscana]|uniref:Uncharacterized protein n=1 Tax=Artemia franciscana TaxID=6661 RepID=A0AA88IIS2_ARTSF|nr:hypothetical protein QYM36_001187 [Artemia franciscana]
MPQGIDISYETQDLFAENVNNNSSNFSDLQDLLLSVKNEREHSNGFMESPNLLKKKVNKPSFFQKLKAKFLKEQHSTEKLEGLGECFTMTLNPGELLRFSAVQTRKDSDSDAAESALLERRKSLTELLNMIYNEARKRNSSGNYESDNGTEYSTTSDYTGKRRNYEVENINEWRLRNKG